MPGIEPPADERELQRLTARREVLRARRAELVRARRAEEAEAAVYPVVMRAVADSRRSRDSASSPGMSRHREALEELMVDIEEVQALIACVGRRVRNLELADDDSDCRRAERAAERGFSALQRLSDDLRRVTAAQEVGDGPR